MDNESLTQIRLTGLRAQGRHGVLDFEREHEQPFVVDLQMWVCNPSSDDLDDTADYSTVATQVIEQIEGRPVNLIETLAANIADTVLEHSQVRAVSITVHKPQAPLTVTFSDVSVTVSRKKEE